MIAKVPSTAPVVVPPVQAERTAIAIRVLTPHALGYNQEIQTARYRLTNLHPDKHLRLHQSDI